MSELMSQGLEEYKAQNYAKAIKLFTAVIETESEASEAYYWRAWSYYDQQEYAQVILDCTESIVLNPSDFAYWVRGKAYEELGELQSAITDFTTSIVLSPLDAITHVSRAFIWEKLGCFDQAIVDYTTALELAPDNTNNLLFRAWAYQELGMDAEALADLLQLQEIDPNRDGLADQIQAIQARLGMPYQSEDAGNLDTASDLMSQGMNAFYAGNYSDAIELFNQVIAIDPDMPDAYSMRAYAYFKLEDYDQAVSDCTKALRSNSTTLAYWVCGTLQKKLGDLDSALMSFTTAIELDPVDATNYFSRAIVLYELNQFDQTVADCTAALKIDSEGKSYLERRSWAYEALGMDTEALADLLQLQKIDPEWHEIQDQIQAIQDRLGDRSQALSAESINFEAAETLETLLAKLDQLTGLPNVKAEVKKLVNLVRVQQLRRERGLATPPLSMHLVFTGNPGTGKTTVARLISQIYKALGLLSKGHLVEMDRSGLVAGFVGQTALKVTDVVTNAKGGILFIDEAYTLVSLSGGSGDFGQEAIDTLLKSMEDYRDDFVVIVAGYPEQMTAFLTSNPGLKSRFNKYVAFEDYTINELCKILDDLCKSSGYFLNESATYYSVELIQDLVSQCSTTFGNARGVRNLFEQAISAQASRVIELENPNEVDLCTLDAADFISTPLVLAAS